MAGEIAPILTALYSVYNVIFQPLLALGPYISLGFFSVCLAGLFSLIYWYFLDIEKAEELKEKMSHHQDKMKEARSNDKTDKASEHMKKSMEVNQDLMKENFKPMIGTMVFVVLIFPWLGATFTPTVDLVQTGNDTYRGNLSFGGASTPVTVEGTDENFTATIDGQTVSKDENFRALGVEWEAKTVKNKSGGLFAEPKGMVFRVAASFVKLPFSLPFAGSELNWLGFYILIAMPLTYIFRKLLGVA